MTTNRPWVFGEVLYDCFPDGSRVLGGAPFNVAWHLQALGQQPLFISRVGRDENGQQIRSAMLDWGMDLTGLQEDKECPTGQVTVTLENGEPAYSIDHPVAYDRIEVPVFRSEAGLVYHGMLALRDSASREALLELLRLSNAPVFIDVNLRDPWWERRAVLQCVEKAKWVKLNQDELHLLAPELEPAGFLETYGLDGLILTMGGRGARYLTSTGIDTRVAPSKTLRLVDTVGAGDALASVMICGLLMNWAPELALERAQEFASAICGQRGATVGQPAFYENFIERWGLG